MALLQRVIENESVICIGKCNTTLETMKQQLHLNLDCLLNEIYGEVEKYSSDLINNLTNFGETTSTKLDNLKSYTHTQFCEIRDASKYLISVTCNIIRKIVVLLYKNRRYANTVLSYVQIQQDILMASVCKVPVIFYSDIVPVINGMVYFGWNKLENVEGGDIKIIIGNKIKHLHHAIEESLNCWQENLEGRLTFLSEHYVKHMVIPEDCDCEEDSDSSTLVPDAPLTGDSQITDEPFTLPQLSLGSQWIKMEVDDNRNNVSNNSLGTTQQLTDVLKSVSLESKAQDRTDIGQWVRLPFSKSSTTKTKPLECSETLQREDVELQFTDTNVLQTTHSPTDSETTNLQNVIDLLSHDLTKLLLSPSEERGESLENNKITSSEQTTVDDDMTIEEIAISEESTAQQRVLQIVSTSILVTTGVSPPVYCLPKPTFKDQSETCTTSTSPLTTSEQIQKQSLHLAAAFLKLQPEQPNPILSSSQPPQRFQFPPPQPPQQQFQFPSPQQTHQQFQYSPPRVPYQFQFPPSQYPPHYFQSQLLPPQQFQFPTPQPLFPSQIQPPQQFKFPPPQRPYYFQSQLQPPQQFQFPPPLQPHRFPPFQQSSTYSQPFQQYPPSPNPSTLPYPGRLTIQDSNQILPPPFEHLSYRMRTIPLHQPLTISTTLGKSDVTRKFYKKSRAKYSSKPSSNINHSTTREESLDKKETQSCVPIKQPFSGKSHVDVKGSSFSEGSRLQELPENVTEQSIESPSSGLKTQEVSGDPSSQTQDVSGDSSSQTQEVSRHPSSQSSSTELHSSNKPHVRNESHSKAQELLRKKDGESRISKRVTFSDKRSEGKQIKSKTLKYKNHPNS